MSAPVVRALDAAAGADAGVREAVLALTALASEPYDRFVWATPDRARAAARVFWDLGVGEVTPGSVHVLEADGAIVGAMSSLTGAALQRARLKAAASVARERSVEMLPEEQERARLAAGAMWRPRADDYYLARLAVSPDARGRGFGALLMDAFRDAAAAVGARRWILEVDAANAPAIAVYRRAGFTVAEERRVPTPDDMRGPGAPLRFALMATADAEPVARPLASPATEPRR